MHADTVFEFLSHLRSVFPIYGKNRGNLSVLFSNLRSHLRSILRRRDSILWTRRGLSGEGGTNRRHMEGRALIDTTGRKFEQEKTEITETDDGNSVPSACSCSIVFPFTYATERNAWQVGKPTPRSGDRGYHARIDEITCAPWEKLGEIARSWRGGTPLRAYGRDQREGRKIRGQKIVV